MIEVAWVAVGVSVLSGPAFQIYLRRKDRALSDRELAGMVLISSVSEEALSDGVRKEFVSKLSAAHRHRHREAIPFEIRNLSAVPVRNLTVHLHHEVRVARGRRFRLGHGSIASSKPVLAVTPKGKHQDVLVYPGDDPVLLAYLSVEFVLKERLWRVYDDGSVEKRPRYEWKKAPKGMHPVRMRLLHKLRNGASAQLRTRTTTAGPGFQVDDEAT